MASSATTIFSNASIRLVSEHAEARAVESSPALQRYTLEHGVRFLCRQTFATRNVSGRTHRLFGWMYICCMPPTEVVRAIQNVREDGGLKGGKGKGAGKQKGKKAKGSPAQYYSRSFGPLEERRLCEQLREEPIYHVVIRGRDPRFCPPGDSSLVDIVTNYFVTGIAELRDLFVKRLEEEVLGSREYSGEEPLEAFQSLMADAGFCALLEEYYKSGDEVSERNLHLAGRLGGNKCFLHNVLKQGEPELLRELLARYTRLDTGTQPWLRLAEPELEVGKYKLSAYHRAVYDGRLSSLDLLLQHAKRAGVDLTALRNRETDKKWVEEHGEEGMTVLEMAEHQENWACYNRLAPFFGVPPRAENIDTKRREEALAELMLPRLDIRATGFDDLFVFPLVDAGDAPPAAMNAAGVDQPGASGRERPAPRAVDTMQGLLRYTERCVRWVAAELIADSRAKMLAEGVSEETAVGPLVLDPRSIHVVVNQLTLPETPSAADAAAFYSGMFDLALAVWREFGGDGAARAEADAASVLLANVRLRVVRVPDPQRATLLFLDALHRTSLRSDLHQRVALSCGWELGFVPHFVVEPGAETGGGGGRAWPANEAVPFQDGDEPPLEGAKGDGDSHCYEAELVTLVEALLRDRVTLGVVCNASYWIACRKVLKKNVSPAQRPLMSGFDFGVSPVRVLSKFVRRDVLRQAEENKLRAGGASETGASAARDEQALRDFGNCLLLLPPIEILWKAYFDIPRLLQERPTDARRNVAEEVVKHVGIMVWLWLLEWDATVTTWPQFCERLLGKFLEMPSYLAHVKSGPPEAPLAARLDDAFNTFRVAFDLALESLVRMYAALDAPYQGVLGFRGAAGERHPYLAEDWFWRGRPAGERGEPPENFVAFVKSLIPPAALQRGSLFRTQRAIQKYETDGDTDL